MRERERERKRDIYLGNIKVALGVCFALKSTKELLLLFTFLISLCKDVTFPLGINNKI